MIRKQMGENLQKTINRVARHRDPKIKEVKKQMLELKKKVVSGSHSGIGEMASKILKNYEGLRSTSSSKVISNKLTGLCHDLRELERQSKK